MRVNDGDVKNILETSIDTTLFIQTASLVVDEELLNSGLSEERLRQIELWLAAHLSCTMDPRIKTEKMGDASNTYQIADGQGLASTTYGLQVLLLDSSGKLANLYKPKATLE